ncbi:MAG TPA: tryptophan halogenase family protein [Steroidobacteraceae bacterium]|nr:tryptophan halogenase family protein [Steroidobacteraceae bacterium]
MLPRLLFQDGDSVADNRLKSIVIVGGGTAGWMAAAALIERFGANRHTRITLVESPEIGTVGVGEATVPHIREFLRHLKINEVDFVKRTSATFKLAIGFEGWAGEGTQFFHPFSEHGVPLLGTSFQHYWVKARQLGKAEVIDRYALSAEMARVGKFAMPKSSGGTGFLFFNYALHFDATLVARYLKSWSIMAGVKHVEGRVANVQLHGESGHVECLELDGGRKVAGDLFIDCSGFAGLLIEKALHTGYDDWTQWLPCDRAVAMPCESRVAPASHTRSIASRAGWQWRIPLQHRVGNGYVFCSRYLSEDEAMTTLRSSVEGPALAEPRLLPFRTGIRRKIWNRNVFCLGLASGFLEPLESTSIYLVQRGLQYLTGSFPQAVPNIALQENVNERNRRHWDHIRDFIVLHYKLNRRDEPFWHECRAMSIPDSLSETIALFRETGRFRQESIEFFRASSWLSMFAGFGILPRYYSPMVDDVPEVDVIQELENMAAGIAATVAGAPTHEEFIRSNCATAMPVQTAANG